MIKKIFKIFQIKYFSKHKSLFGLQKYIVLYLALFLTILALSFGLFVSEFLLHPKQFAWFLCIEVLVMYVVSQIFYFPKYRELKKERKDLKIGDVIDVEVYLKTSVPMLKRRFFNIPNFILAFFFFGDKVSFQKCTFSSMNGIISEENYFYYAISKDKEKVFRQLFDVDISYWDIGIWVKEILFKENIPLRIIYGRKSHVLMKVLPIADFSYSSKQLELIKLLNDRYMVDTYIPMEREYMLVSLQRWVMRRKVFPLFLAPIFLILISLVFSVCLDSLLLYVGYILIDIFDYSGIPVLSEYFLRINLVIYALAYFFIMFNSIIFFPSKNNKELDSRNVYLKKSRSAGIGNGYSSSLKYFFPKEYPIFQRIQYEYVLPRKMGEEIDYAYFVLTSAKYEVLKQLYDCEIDHCIDYTVRQGLGMMTHFIFAKGVPLKINIELTNQELKSIAPVEGYEYTEEQLAAIEKFNTLYP